MNENTPIQVLVQPHGGGPVYSVLAPKRAKLGQRVAAVVYLTTATGQVLLAACDPQRHPETGLELAFYGKIVQVGDVLC